MDDRANANPLRMTDPKGMQAGEFFEGFVRGFLIQGPLGIIRAAADQGYYWLCPICHAYEDAKTLLDPATYKGLQDLTNDPGRLGEFGGKIGFDLLFYKKVAGLRFAAADAASAQAVEGASSALAPGGGLQAHENAGGHLIARHVGKTEAELADRLAKSTGKRPLQTASSFVDRTEAEAAASHVLDVNADQVTQWLATNPSGQGARLILNAPFSGGRVLQRGAASAVPGTGARLVLEGDGAGRYFILTGFPTP